MAHVYLLDPANGVMTLETVPIRDAGSVLGLLIGTSGVGKARYDDHHTIYFDDGGLHNGVTAYTLFDGYPEPLCGKVVVAPNSLATSSGPSVGMEMVLGQCRCYRAVLDPVIETVERVDGEVHHFISRVTEFKPRVERILLRMA